VPATSICAPSITRSPIVIRSGSGADAIACTISRANGDHRVVGGAVDHLGVELAGVLEEPGEVALVVGGVGHRQVALILQAVAEEIVEHAAVRRQQQAVLGATDRDPRDVVGAQALQQCQRPRPGGFDLAHVRDVERAGGAAHGEMLLAHAVVADRHLPAGVGHHPRPKRDVGVVKRGVTKVGRHEPQT
jgi:hypothetical protein